MSDIKWGGLLGVAHQNIKASGGWCAPSHPIYADGPEYPTQLSEFSISYGLLDLPTISVTRNLMAWSSAQTRPLPEFSNCPSFGPSLGMLKPLDLGLFIS